MVAAPAVALLQVCAAFGLTTLPATAVVIGTALSAWAASMISRRTGRQGGFLIGTGLATVSGALCFSAVIYMNFSFFQSGLSLASIRVSRNFTGLPLPTAFLKIPQRRDLPRFSWWRIFWVNWRRAGYLGRKHGSG